MNSPVQAMDHLEPHLRTIFGFIGITELTFLNVQPMDEGSEEEGKANLSKGIELASTLVK